MKLSELANYLYLFGNDIRVLHLLSIGDEFENIHSMLNDIYDIAYDFFDFACESAISHDESIYNPSTIINTVEWNPIIGNSFTQEESINYCITNGNFILDCVKQVTEYESWTQSKIDEFASDLDKIINYKMKQMLK